MRTFGALGHRSFVLIWTANAVALTGIATFDAASAWLMTSLDPEPFMVSLVQTATVLPMFLLTIVGGALADVVRPRRFLIANSATIALVVATFAAIVSAGRETSASLLTTIFVLSGAWALNAPAWLAIIPGLVPPEELESAIAASGLAYNLSRLVGPSAFVLATAVLGAAAPFWAFCGCNVVAIALLAADRTPRPSEAGPSPERVWRAIGVGVRHAVHNRRLHPPLVRAFLFFAFASVSTALLPLVARHALGRPELYGVLLSAVALGSVAGSLAFVSLRRRLGLDRVVATGSALSSAALVLFGAAHGVAVLLLASLVAGFAGLLVLGSLYVAAQQVLPNWVRGRGLAILLTVVFGSVSLSSAGWGKLASADDPSRALFIAAAGLILTIPLTARLRLEGGGAIDLEPSLHYRRMSLARAVGDDEGPILATVDYRIDPAHRAAFLEAVAEMGHERLRDGAARWGVFEDVEDSGRFVETFSLDSWLDLRLMRERVTRSDWRIEGRIEAMLREPRRARFHVAPQRKPQAPFVGAPIQAVIRMFGRRSSQSGAPRPANGGTAAPDDQLQRPARPE